MKIEKLPSGSYRIRKMYQGKTYTIVTEYKPTQKEALQLMADELSKVQGRHERMTFQRAAEEYIASKHNVLSPSTVQGYEVIIRNLPESFLDKNIHDITALDVQMEINKMSGKQSPKTVRNRHGFLSAVLGAFCPDLKLNTTLPQKVKNDSYIPSDEDVKRILEYAHGTKYEIPLILACYGLRRSEICALQPEDVDGDIVTINKAKVQNEHKEWVIKTTKTTASTREIIIPMEVADKIREQGYVYNGYPGKLTDFLTAAQTKLELPHFPLHKLRHYFASKMSAMNVPEADIMKFGGWETDYVMKGVYRHAMEDKNRKAQREAADKLSHVLFS
ncbi:MAG: site-specific integrase [Firmicutes bacterium]|nr:site-specific integrase [Bacillota bacterium]